MVIDRLGDLKAVLKDNYEASNEITINMDYTDSYLSEFFMEVESITNNLDKIVASVEELKKKHNAILSSPTPDEKIKQELESLMADIKRLSSSVREKLKLMEQNVEQQEHINNSSAELRIKRTQHSALFRRFVDAMTEYSSIQTEYRERCKNRIKCQLEITGNVKTDAEIEEMLENGNPEVFTQGLVIETQKAKQSLADIEARHADIMKLEKSIKELHDMFLDMAIIVESQRELVDRVEYNVQNTTDYIANALSDINTAITYQKKARKKKIILIIILIVVLAIIGLVIGLTVK